MPTASPKVKALKGFFDPVYPGLVSISSSKLSTSWHIISTRKLSFQLKQHFQFLQYLYIDSNIINHEHSETQVDENRTSWRSLLPSIHGISCTLVCLQNLLRVRETRDVQYGFTAHHNSLFIFKMNVTLLGLSGCILLKVGWLGESEAF